MGLGLKQNCLCAGGRGRPAPCVVGTQRAGWALGPALLPLVRAEVGEAQVPVRGGG